MILTSDVRHVGTKMDIHRKQIIIYDLILLTKRGHRPIAAMQLICVNEIKSKNDTTMPNLLMPMIPASNFIKNYKNFVRLSISIHIVSSSDRFY
jgi:hypothetical protein